MTSTLLPRRAVCTRLVLVTAMVAAAVCLLGSGASPARADAAGPCGSGQHWVGAWEGAPSDGANPLAPAMVMQTVRDIVTPHLGGQTLRLHLSNRFGNLPVTFSSVYVARRSSGAALVAGTNTQVRFAGRATVTVPAHTDVVSDPVTMPFAAFDDVAVSITVPLLTVMPTEHFAARQTSYLSGVLSGDRGTDASGRSFTATTTSWLFLDGIDVLAPPDAASVVTLGDSITDGWIAGPLPIVDDAATRDANGRYPDFLARRLQSRTTGPRLSVLNAGISGNQVLADGVLPPMYGPSALHRLTDDVIDQAGVEDVIVMEGTNDLNPLETVLPGASAADVIGGLKKLVRRLHRHGLTVLLGTLPPRSDDRGTTLARRLAVNRWIKTTRLADGVVDFAAALADPADPSRLRPAYDSGDHLHPSVAGYQAMANAVNLDLLSAPRCPRS